jgi:hypothetical protein
MAAMRKVIAWFGAATLVVLWSISAHANSNVLKPYVVLILDTSGSMLDATGSGPPSCGGPDTKLNHARCAINNITNSYGDMVFAFARFREQTAGTFSTSCDANGDENGDPNGWIPNPGGGDQCSTQGAYCGDCDPSTGVGRTCSRNSDCLSQCTSSGCSAGTCSGGHCVNTNTDGLHQFACTQNDDLFQLLTPLVDGNNAAAATLTDGICGDCSITGTNPEVWGASPYTFTPLAAVLRGDKRYWSGQQASDGLVIWPTASAGFAPIANDPTKTVFLPTGCDPSPTCTSNCCATQCRPYITILLTDGAETCTTFGNTQAAAASLLTTDISNRRYRIVTKPIGFGVTPGDSEIEGIAHSGGAPDVPSANEGYYASDEAGVELAISQIIEGSIRSEVCNDLDDDCDTRIDEDFPTKGNACDNGLLGVCKGTGTLGCKADGTGLQCNINNPGGSPTTEICNNLDDDCDGKVDEDTTGCTCIPSPEICNGKDDDCDGVIDNGVGPKGCAKTNTFGSCPGTEQCVNGAYGACSAATPTAETCDGKDNNCDGVCDGFNAACSNVNTPGGPASDNLGDPSHSPIPQNVCHPGEKLCPASCGASNGFGACTGEEQGCNPHQDGTIHCDVCNGKDDDCDNKVDEDFVPADCSTNCGIGQTQCVNGQIVCNSMPAGDDTTCDGIDDDCDGAIDEDWTCDPSPSCTGANCCACGTGTTCEVNKCIGGHVTCTTTQPINPEQCNCQDDDCDGTVDENVTCGAGGSCVQCQCAFPCGEGEFPCPMGKKCDKTGGNPGFCVTDPCYGVNCMPDGQGNQTTCVPKTGDPTMAMCVPTCSVMQCPSGEVCVGSTGVCAPNDCTTFPQMCAANQNCVVDSNGMGQCVTNLCQGVTCPADQYCEQGNCVSSCADVTCPSGQRCRLGQCETDPCGMPCPSGQVCNDPTGTCHDDPCQFRQCAQGQWCNPNDGQCESDPCIGTMCPSPDQICRGGTCYNPDQFLPDAGVDTHVTVGGGGGCSTTGTSDSGLLLGLALLLVRRRRGGGGK